MSETPKTMKVGMAAAFIGAIVAFFTMALAWRLEVILSTTMVLGVPEVAEDCNLSLMSSLGTEASPIPKSLNTLTATGGMASKEVISL